MRVRLSPSFEPVKAAGTAVPGTPLLDPKGPLVVLGWNERALAEPVAPSPSTLFGPRGACLHPDGSLWVCDTGHHRLLGWHRAPTDDNAPADIVIGQDDFEREGRNAQRAPDAASLNVPTGLIALGSGLAVADAWNHRVLIWHEVPRRNGQPADVVLGQADFTSGQANRGRRYPRADTLHWPYGLALIGERLLIADTGNRRVLAFDAGTDGGWRSGDGATTVLGQHDFGCRDENAGMSVSPMGMRWPHAIAQWRGRLAVADAGNNRIMLWSDLDFETGAHCNAVLGQGGFSDCDHNLGAYYPSAAALNMPYALALAGEQLVVADTANSRLLGWRDASTGSSATALSGQDDFASKGDNRWGLATRDSLCWPYGLSILGSRVAIADSGNNRVLLWDLAT